jgi:hypothetical protein
MQHRAREVEELREALSREDRFSGLTVLAEGERAFVRGELPIFDADGQEIDRYELDIEVPRDPVLLPVVRETRGRIPWTAERHMFKNGVACVMLPDERWKYFPVGTPFVDFLRGPLSYYLLGQSMVEEGLPWPAERRHNADGVLDYYRELFETEDLATILRSLYLLTCERVKGHWECPCGSGAILRRCCRERFELMRKRVHWRTAQSTWEWLDLKDVRPYSGDRLRAWKDLAATVSNVLSTRGQA